jgi:hypothetical protein
MFHLIVRLQALLTASAAGGITHQGETMANPVDRGENIRMEWTVRDEFVSNNAADSLWPDFRHKVTGCPGQLFERLFDVCRMHRFSRLGNRLLELNDF